MPLFRHVRRLLGDRGVVHECRRCGTTLDPPVERCEVCGCEEVARFDIE